MLKTTIKILVISITQFLLVTCDNYEFPKSPYPRIETLPVVNISETGVTFQATITQIGEKEITNHGFVWGPTENLSIANEDKIQLGGTSKLGNFAADVKSGLLEGETYFVKAFVGTTDYFVYGEAVSFTSKGSTPPVIKSFSPIEGTWGDTVTISGSYFSALAKNNIVKFGNLESKVIASNDTTIKCIVPDDIPNKTVPIYVAVVGNQTQSTNNFVLITPTIESFLPTQATFEDVVTIFGTNFSPIKERNIVKFNEHIAEVTESSNSQLKVKVPTAIRKKENIISVTVNLQTANANETFIIAPPSINSLSKTEAFIGETIQINGHNFNPTITGNAVQLGGTPATILNSTNSSLTILLPSDIYKKRSFQIEIITAEQSSLSMETFTLLNPWIRKANVPPNDQERDGAVAFTINGEGYIGLGGGFIGNNMYKYNPENNKWSEITPFPGGQRYAATSFVINNKAYVGLGVLNPVTGFELTNDFWSYDPINNSWSQVANFPYSTYRAIGFSLNGEGFVITNNETDNFWKYDPHTNSWTQKVDHPEVVFPYNFPSTGFSLNEKIFTFCNDGSTGPNQFYEYDFNTDNWSKKADIELSSAYGPTGFAVNGHGYIRESYILYKYNPITNTWRNDLQDPLGLREYSIAFEIQGKIYFGTGQGHNDLWEFDPDYEQ
jgi:N-acetylneuraminic acid mutarotase